MIIESLPYDEVHVEIDLPEPLYRRLKAISFETGMELSDMILQILFATEKSTEFDLGLSLK